MAEIDANALSVISLLTLLANAFEAERKGAIAVIGSVAGDRGRQSNYVYGAAKGMVAIYLSGPAQPALQIRRHGDADQAGLRRHADDGEVREEGRPAMGRAARDRQDHRARGHARRGEVYAPAFWRWIMLAVRNIPEALFKRMRM